MTGCGGDTREFKKGYGKFEVPHEEYRKFNRPAWSNKRHVHHTG